MTEGHRVWGKFAGDEVCVCSPEWQVAWLEVLTGTGLVPAALHLPGSKVHLSVVDIARVPGPQPVGLKHLLHLRLLPCQELRTDQVQVLPLLREQGVGLLRLLVGAFPRDNPPRAQWEELPRLSKVQRLVSTLTEVTTTAQFF